MDEIFIDIEPQVLQSCSSAQLNTTTDYILALVKLGDYLNRKSDLPPGEKIITRELEILGDIVAGAMSNLNSHLKDVGN